MFLFQININVSTIILSNVYIQCALIYLKSDISSINNNYLFTDSTNTIGIYGQSIQILKNKIDINYNTNDIELFDAILSAVYSNLRLDAFPRFEKSMFYKTYIKYKSMELNHKCSISISYAINYIIFTKLNYTFLFNCFNSLIVLCSVQYIQTS